MWYFWIRDVVENGIVCEEELSTRLRTTIVRAVNKLLHQKTVNVKYPMLDKRLHIVCTVRRSDWQ